MPVLHDDYAINAEHELIALAKQVDAVMPAGWKRGGVSVTVLGERPQHGATVVWAQHAFIPNPAAPTAPEALVAIVGLGATHAEAFAELLSKIRDLSPNPSRYATIPSPPKVTT